MVLLQTEGEVALAKNQENTHTRIGNIQHWQLQLQIQRDNTGAFLEKNRNLSFEEF